MKVRKIIFLIGAPVRFIKHLYGDWVNKSDTMPADWLRRKRLDKLGVKYGK